MRFLSLLKKLLFFLLFISIFIIYFCEHISTDTFAKELYAGGEIVYYDLCLVNNQSLKVEFPLLSATKVNSIQSLKLSNNKAYSKFECSLSFKPLNLKYKDCFVNYFTVIIRQKTNNEEKLSMDIDGFDLTIDKKKFKYTTPHFKICNSYALLDKNESSAPITEFSKIGNSTSLEFIPTNDNLATAYYSIAKNIYLINIKSSSFYDIDTCNINGDSYDANNIYINMHDQRYISLQYSLKYRNNMYKRYFTRSYFMITYEKDCEIKKYISNSELYITPNQNNNQVTSSYIDGEYVR